MNKKIPWMPVLLAAILVSCHPAPGSLTAAQSATVSHDVEQMTAAIAKDVSQEGPAAWLRYFEASPDFYMASEGRNVFPTIGDARHFINTTLIKEVRSIQLRWSDIHIDPYTTALAGVRAGYHEDLTDITGKTISQDGYFTATAEHSFPGWQLRNAHWSVVPVK